MSTMQPAVAAQLIDCPHCQKKGCRGEIGLHMHIQRAHKRNWSTKSKKKAA